MKVRNAAFISKLVCAISCASLQVPLAFGITQCNFECFDESKCNCQPPPSPSSTATPNFSATSTATPAQTPTSTPTSTLTPTVTPKLPTPEPTPIAQIVLATPTPSFSLPQCSISLEKQLLCEGGDGVSSFTLSGNLISASDTTTGILAWSVTCAGAVGQLSNPSTGELFGGSAPISATQVTLAVSQPRPTQGGTCSVLGQVRKGTAVTAECGYTVSVLPCEFGCTSVDVSSTLFGLDGSLRDQKVAAVLSARLLRLATKNQAAATQEESLANSLYGLGWAAVWAFPAVVTQCTNSVACQSVSTASYSSDFKNRSQQLYDLAKSLLRRVKGVKPRSQRLNRQIRKIERQVEAYYKDASAEAVQIPASLSDCTTATTANSLAFSVTS